MASNGKLIAILPAEEAEAAVAAVRQHPLGKETAVIGEVTSDHPGFVVLKTRVGGRRIVDMLSGNNCRGSAKRARVA